MEAFQKPTYDRRVLYQLDPHSRRPALALERIAFLLAASEAGRHRLPVALEHDGAFGHAHAAIDLAHDRWLLVRQIEVIADQQLELGLRLPKRRHLGLVLERSHHVAQERLM